MKNKYYLLFILVVLINTGCSSVKEAKYDVLEKDGKFEIRYYEPKIIAETIVDGTLENAGNKAFNRLFRYISGNNRSQTKIAMTAPVEQNSANEKIKMTAPVEQRQVDEKWAVSFMMPASYTIESLPRPKDSNISIRQVPAQEMAAIRYSGFWSKKSYLKNKADLELWIKKKGLTSVGDPVWARYNPPFTLWFLRRNEILIKLDKKPKTTP